MALLGKFIPNFEHLNDDDLHRRLHCWEQCALVSFRTHRQMARMHVRQLREEITRRETLRALAGVPTAFTAPPPASQDDILA
jgi:hypothetical protein